jgi:glucose-6-phosphate 1-epimerase
MSLPLPESASLAEHPRLGTCLTLKSAHGTAIVALHGATAFSYVPTGAEDLLWLSPDAVASPGKAIRGGIPLCGPWFGPHALLASASMHGLLRTQAWTLLRVEETAAGIRAEFTLSLPADPGRGWVHTAEALCTVTLENALVVELTLRNTGTTPLLVSGALHTYLAVGDVRQASVTGVGDRDYIDYTHGRVRRRAAAGDLVLNEESARFFFTQAPVSLVDPVFKRTIQVESSGHGATVVWNPWDKTAATMADVGDRWPEFICIEAANIPETAVPLAPATSHHLTTRLYHSRSDFRL